MLHILKQRVTTYPFGNVCQVLPVSPSPYKFARPPCYLLLTVGNEKL